MYKSIKFNDYDLKKDFNLIITKREVEAPAPKTNFVEVDGADGSLDFSEVFGEVKFERRTLKYSVTSLSGRKDFWKDFSKIQNAVHGRECKIIDEEDAGYYYLGRISINKWSIDKVFGTFEITCECEPYKYHLYLTKRVENIEGTKTISCKNDRMSINPTFCFTSSMTVIFNGTSITVGKDDINKDIVLTNVRFKEGNNILKFIGTGTVSISYQEGSL